VLINIFLSTLIKAETFKSHVFTSYLKSYPQQKVSRACKKFTCGPTTIIYLDLNGANSSLHPNYGMGEKGFFAQMMNIGEAMDNQGVSGVINHTLSQRKVHSKPSSLHDKTTISLPMIDYGFTGSFNNILITVSNTQPRYKYSSSVMGLTNKDSSQIFVGTVAIDEYTPFVMRGSYSAKLNRYGDIPIKDQNCPAFSDPSTPPCQIRKLIGTGKINGTFSINTPPGAINKHPATVTTRDDIDPFISDIKSMAAAYGI